jgi:hypothetical protein
MDERPVNVAVGHIARRIVAVLAVLTLLIPGCSKGAGGGGGGGDTDNVLTIGTTYYISSLNPFVGIETQDSTAYSMLYPQLLQYGPGLKLEGDWASLASIGSPEAICLKISVSSFPLISLA